MRLDVTGWIQENIDAFLIAFVLGIVTLIGIAVVWVPYGKGAGTALIWTLACLASGAAIGFLFGIPRVAQIEPVPEREGQGQQTAHALASDRPAAFIVQPNTNLEQVSDWLTKIIVGVGLVEFHAIREHFLGMARVLGSGLGETDANTGAGFVVAQGLIAYFSVVGFLGGYLLTRLFLARAMVTADTLMARRAERVKEEVERQAREVLKAGGETARVPPERQKASAERINSLAADLPLAAIRDQLLALAREYETVRASMPSGSARTQRMEMVVVKMRAYAGVGQFLLAELASSAAPGARLAAIALLEIRPNADRLTWLADRFDREETPFVAYHAAVALHVAAESLPLEALDAVEKALIRARELAKARPPDSERDEMLEAAEKTLARRRGVQRGGNRMADQRDRTVANVHLINEDWDQVNVEVRRGNETDCALNAAFETKLLARGDEWVIPAPGVDVCYRRDADPDHPNGQWTEWRRVDTSGGGEITETIV
jgi:hypothetical protein